ncbi:MAG: tetratricopeptide repeat protein [Candidatus Obscuribacterales bacterium]|nr:tetratricopeptide repeat protein [Candidatus Obscuribacterales bacterium]
MNPELQALAAKHGLESNELALPLSRQAAAYFRAGEYHGAECLMELAVQIMEKQPRSPQEDVLPYAMRFLAEIYRIRGRSEKALNTMDGVYRLLLSPSADSKTAAPWSLQSPVPSFES